MMPTEVLMCLVVWCVRSDWDFFFFFSRCYALEEVALLLLFQPPHFAFLPLPLSFLFLDYSIIHAVFLLSSLLALPLISCNVYK